MDLWLVVCPLLSTLLLSHCLLINCHGTYFLRKSTESGTACVLGSGASGMQFFAIVWWRHMADGLAPPFSAWTGIAKLLVFHPVDIIMKQLMLNKLKACTSNLSSVILHDKTSAFSLFPGSGYTAGYKISQCIDKFGGWATSSTAPPSSVMCLSRCSANNIGRLWCMLLQAAWLALVRLSGSLSRPQDQDAGQSQCVPQSWCVLNIFRGKHTLLQLGMDYGECPGSFAVMHSPLSTLHLTLTPYSPPYTALWCLGSNERVCSQHQRLLQGDLDPIIALVAGAITSIIIAAPLETVTPSLIGQTIASKGGIETMPSSFLKSSLLHHSVLPDCVP